MNEYLQDERTQGRPFFLLFRRILTCYKAVHGPCCFTAGTLVLTNNGQKSIEEIQEGDFVYATNPETGESGYRRVVQTFERETDEIVQLQINGETITTTPGHPFYVPQKGWTKAIELRAGDILVTSNGEYVILEKTEHEIIESPVKVYNFEVEEFHTYYVGGLASILVHNTCRANAVRKAWKNEFNNVKNGGDGISRVWSVAEKAELLDKGKVAGYVGHHMKSVAGYPELAGDPSNIQFLTKAEHLLAHFGNWRNVTHGMFIG